MVGIHLHALGQTRSRDLVVWCLKLHCLRPGPDYMEKISLYEKDLAIWKRPGIIFHGTDAKAYLDTWGNLA